MKKALDPDALLAAKIERDVSFRELGRLAECPHNLLSKLLQGKATSDDNAERLARALRRDVGDLFVDAASNVEQDAVHQKAVQEAAA